MNKTKTTRGFTLIKFKDNRGEMCYLCKSSYATEDCVLIGLNDGKSQMRLNMEQVKELLPYLQKFADTGDL